MSTKTEAQHYRRYLLQQKVADRHAGTIRVETRVSTDKIGRAPRGLNDGKGFVFISQEAAPTLELCDLRHQDDKGEVFPSGFLPMWAGSIREQTLESIYRESPLFRDLRDTSKLERKCGACEFKQICGGSRSRAYALTGNPLAEEACCAYIPKGYERGNDSAQRKPSLHVLQGA